MRFLALSLLVVLSSGPAVLAQTRAKTKRPTPKAVAPAPVQPAETSASRLPPGYTGHNAAAIFAALQGVRGSLRKSQFETTLDYEARLERIVSVLPGASIRLTFLLPDTKLSYDADASAFSIKVQPEAVLFPKTYVAGNWDRQYDRFTSFYLWWTKKTVGSSVGHNAFGVKRRYVITIYTSLRLAVPAESVRRLTAGLQLPVTPSSAKFMYPGIRLVVTGRLVPPYGGEENEVDNATISEPEEAHYFKYYLYFEPDAAVVYDIRTGEVYGSLDLNEPSPESRSILYSQPTVLEDPLERQQRLEEARREYPPEHVFKKSEVAKPAVIFSRPEPAFTEAARAAVFSGSVLIRVVLKYDGTVEILGASKELPYGLTQKAIEAAKAIRFTPAERNGRAVSQEFAIEYHFNTY